MIDELITALSKGVEMSAKEIADTIWLALQMQESQSESISPSFSSTVQDGKEINTQENQLDRNTSPTDESGTSDSQKTAANQPPAEPQAGIYPRNQQQTSKTKDLSFKVPDAPSLGEPLTLARALKPLMRRLPSGRELVLDEVATIQQIVDRGIWIPVLRPTLEPWLDLELVVDEAISMQIWRHTIRELERLLKNYGIFRDVRIWGLITDDNQQVQIRRGMGATAKNQSFRSPKELIDPSGRRLVLVVSDCVSSGWRNGGVTPVLELWGKQGAMAIVQMLPKWLWKRTALGRASEVRLRGLTPGMFNQKLIAKEVSLWDELEEETGVKVPVFTLEQDKVVTWAQMLSGKGSVWTWGYVFKLDANPVKKESGLFNLAHGDLSAEQRVQAFRVTASPMARKLAGLLACAPVISLPIVRLIRETLLKDAQQVNVAEVFLGGLLRPLSEINADTNPDYVQYEFIDGVRELFVDSVPSNYVLNVVDEVSKYVAKKVGLSLEDFAAVLRKDKQVEDRNVGEKIGYFATVTAEVLRRLGGEYVKVADSLINNTSVNKVTTEIEQNRHLLWQHGNTKIYSVCTDKPWNLPFNGLVIPFNPTVNRFGSFARYFAYCLEKKLLISSIEQAKKEKNKNKITPNEPLLVALPSEINTKLFPSEDNRTDRFIICATIEFPGPSIVNAYVATKSVIFMARQQEFSRVIMPLLGTGNLGLPIDDIALSMLTAITHSLRELSSNKLEEIIIVDKRESTIRTIHQVAQSLFFQEDLENTLSGTDNHSLFEQVNNPKNPIINILDDKSIRIIGDRGAGKTTFMAALASLSRTDSEIPFLVFPQNRESQTLLYATEEILRQGLSLPPTNVNILEELPFYSFRILLKPSLFIQPFAAIRGKTIEMNISFKEYPGELFNDLKNNRQDRQLYSEYLDDCATVSKLLFLIDGNTRDDRGYTESCTRLSEEINQRLNNNKEILNQYRIAIVISKCEEPLLWIYRYKAEELMYSKFPKTKRYFEQLNKSWGCKIAYFACSSFGVLGKSPRPNFTFMHTDERGTIGVIRDPAKWKPFGLLAPIYWLDTGKHDPRLQQ